MGVEQTVKGGQPFVPVTDGVHKAIGDPGVNATETWAAMHKTIFNFSNTPIPTTDSAGVAGYGSKKLYDFLAGVIEIFGIVVNLTTQKQGAGIAASAAVVASIGSAPAAADATLTGTEADMIASTVATLNASGAGTFKAKTGATPIQFDGSTTPLDMYLNIAIPDAGSTANDALLVTGTIAVFWTNLGKAT